MSARAVEVLVTVAFGAAVVLWLARARAATSAPALADVVVPAVGCGLLTAVLWGPSASSARLTAVLLTAGALWVLRGALLTDAVAGPSGRVERVRPWWHAAALAAMAWIALALAPMAPGDAGGMAGMPATGYPLTGAAGPGPALSAVLGVALLLVALLSLVATLRTAALAPRLDAPALLVLADLAADTLLAGGLCLVCLGVLP